MFECNEIFTPQGGVKAGDIRDTVWSLGGEDPLEEDMAIHSSILAWRIPIDRGAWQATVHEVAQSRTQLRWLSTHITQTKQRKEDTIINSVAGGEGGAGSTGKQS